MSANLHLLRSFTFQVSEGNLWGQLDVASEDAMLNIETGNGDVSVSLRSEYAHICPFSGNRRQHACLYLQNESTSLGTLCNANLSANGQVILRGIASQRELESVQLPEGIVFHNQTLDAFDAMGTAVQGTSYVVLTSGTPHRSAFLKPREAVRYVVLPSQSFAGASFYVQHVLERFGTDLKLDSSVEALRLDLDNHTRGVAKLVAHFAVQGQRAMKWPFTVEPNMQESG